MSDEAMQLATRYKVWDFLTRTLFRRAHGYHNERIPKGMYDRLYWDVDHFKLIVIGRSCPATERSMHRIISATLRDDGFSYSHCPAPGDKL